jgi:hypothetical protein
MIVIAIVKMVPPDHEIGFVPGEGKKPGDQDLETQGQPDHLPEETIT